MDGFRAQDPWCWELGAHLAGARARAPAIQEPPVPCWSPLPKCGDVRSQSASLPHISTIAKDIFRFFSTNQLTAVNILIVRKDNKTASGTPLLP